MDGITGNGPNNIETDKSRIYIGFWKLSFWKEKYTDILKMNGTMKKISNVHIGVPEIYLVTEMGFEPTPPKRQILPIIWQKSHCWQKAKPNI